MFVRIVKESIVRKGRRKVIAIAAVTLGATVATAMLAVALGIGDNVNRELRSYGANIQAVPRGRAMKVTTGGVQYQVASAYSFISEADLPKLKSIFWSNNILAFSPFVELPVNVWKVGSGGTNRTLSTGAESKLIGTWFDHPVHTENGQPFITGVRKLSPWWKIEGAWPVDGECLAGIRLHDNLGVNPGDQVTVQYRRGDGFTQSGTFRVSGIVSTGSDEDHSIVAGLSAAQKLAGIEGRVERVEVSALTNPDDPLAHRDPGTLSPAEFERWSCTPYVNAVAHDVEQALPGSDVHPVLRISETEGGLLKRVNSMLLLIAIAALVAAVLGVASTMMTTVLERRSEIGLLKAIGASNFSVTAIFLAEAT
ncbi:MAG TPA: ABC transporter permease, partial [Blastocatellia bacterium]|nr:ABC transporter permease [Blastocatellia bacterium]